MLLVQVARIFYVSLAHLTYSVSGFESMPVTIEARKDPRNRRQCLSSAEYNS
jgi:hypothetical protein